MTVKSSLLEMLEKNKGEVLSGESIAGELGCTRAAVWKAVKSLREEGYHIEAGPNKGYMLAKDTNRLSQEGIRLFLDDPKVKIDIYDELESTNQTAKKEAMMGEAGHGAFVIARSQTAGRGRRGREFYSPADTGLYMSVILKPQGTIHDSLLITTAAAVAVYRAVAQICGIQLDIKWVNDLFYKGKKVCGILTEAVTDFESGNIEFVVVGMGLNLYLDQENMPAELRNIAGALYETKEDALSDYFHEIVAGYIRECRTEKIGRFHNRSSIVHALKYFDQYEMFIGKLVDAKLQYILWDAMNDYMSKRIMPKYKIPEYELYFYGGALLNVFLKWQKDQKKESAEQIADSIIKSMGLPVTSHPTKCEDDGINA